MMDLLMSCPWILPTLKRSDWVDNASAGSDFIIGRLEEGTIDQELAASAAVEAMATSTLVDRQDEARREPSDLPSEWPLPFLLQFGFLAS